MRIPLDHYRILGVPDKAPDEQIKQAYEDRLLQLPRREYSDLAIRARKNLLKQSYESLRPAQRSLYDQQLRSQKDLYGKSSVLNLPLDEHHNILDLRDGPWIEIEQQDFVGALLILQELGEYELVLKLGEIHLDKKHSLPLERGIFGEPALARADLILSMALSYLDLAREQWLQKEYEAAAQCSQQGQNLLLQEGLFSNVRGELQADLFKLRPYRILELLSQEPSAKSRRKGLALLHDMLESRGGMDGDGDDQSGLGKDDFLRFIQQLRRYMTVTEQQELFLKESRRPSAVATYLAIYALLAGGFAERKPSLVFGAKEMLMRLSGRQDVHLEQAIAALLLGQTEEANKALELSQEYESLAFIQENSQGSPDLLPGLCLYTEKWLKTEVFSQFRDLQGEAVSLKDYFADPQVQTTLDNLPTAGINHQWSVQRSQAIADPQAPIPSPPSAPTTPLQKPQRPAVVPPEAPPVTAPPPSPSHGAAPPTRSPIPQKKPTVAPESPPTQGDRPLGKKGKKSPFPRMSKPPKVSPKVGESKGKKIKFARGRKRSLPPAIIPFALASGAVVLLAIVWANREPIPTITAEATQLEVPLTSPLYTLTSPSDTAATGETLSTNTATQAVNAWLEGKKAAFGPDHNADRLNSVLANPMLNQWRNLSNDYRVTNKHRIFTHEVEVLSVKTNETDRNRGTIEARIRESVEDYQNNQPTGTQSYEVTVRYGVVKEGDRWLLSSSQIVD